MLLLAIAFNNSPPAFLVGWKYDSSKLGNTELIDSKNSSLIILSNLATFSTYATTAFCSQNSERVNALYFEYCEFEC